MSDSKYRIVVERVRHVMQNGQNVILNQDSTYDAEDYGHDVEYGFLWIRSPSGRIVTLTDFVGFVVTKL